MPRGTKWVILSLSLWVLLPVFSYSQELSPSSISQYSKEELEIFLIRFLNLSNKYKLMSESYEKQLQDSLKKQQELERNYQVLEQRWLTFEPKLDSFDNRLIALDEASEDWLQRSQNFQTSLTNLELSAKTSEATLKQVLSENELLKWISIGTGSLLVGYFLYREIRDLLNPR